MLKPSRKVLITSSILLALSVGGVVTYLNHDNSTEKALTDRSATAEKASTENVSKATNDDPMKNAPIESVILSKFYYGKEKGKNTAGEKPRIDEAQFITASEKFISPDKLRTALSLLDKNKTQVDAIDPASLNGIEIFYNSKNVVEGVTLDIITSSAKQIKEFVGKPVFQVDNKALLYHGQAHDFIIYSTDDKLFNKMTIMPVLDQVLALETVEAPPATEEESSSQVETDDDNDDVAVAAVNTPKDKSTTSQKSTSKKTADSNKSTKKNNEASTKKSPTQPKPTQPAPVVSKPSPVPSTPTTPVDTTPQQPEVPKHEEPQEPNEPTVPDPIPDSGSSDSVQEETPSTP